MAAIARGVALFVVTAALLVIAACGDGAGPGGTASPLASIPPGDFPTGVTDFARTLDRAFAQGNLDLTKFTQFSDWSCPNNYFPAAGPNCVEAVERGGVQAVAIGAQGSEGDIYDGPSYGRFMDDWIYDALRETSTADTVGQASDEYGDGSPRVFALADMPEQFEGPQGKLGTYEIIATRIAPSPDGKQRREVLTFYVSGTLHGWLITRLQRSPSDFLNPASEEATAGFTAWQRWAEPAPPGPLASRWAPERGARQIAYRDKGGVLFVANADGTRRRTIAESLCRGSGPGKESPSWSRDADRIALLCGFEGAPGNRSYLEVYDLDGGEPAVIDNVATFVWSPRGHQVAYQTADIRSEPPATIVRLRDLDFGEDTLVHDNAVLLDWGRKLLLGLNPRWSSGVGYFDSYEANWYDLETGLSGPVARFDDQNQFWLSSVENKAVVLDGPAARKEGGTTLAVYDLDSRQETRLNGLFIGYGSAGIPLGMIQASPIDARFVWADHGLSAVVISEAALDGSQATLLDRVTGLIDSVSSDGLVLYHTSDTVMVLLDTKTGARTGWNDAVMGAIAPVVIPRS